MNKEISSKTTVVVFGVLIILSLVAFYVFADWNEPSQTPPAGNVPAPINVGDEAQQKTGTLTVPIVYDRDDPSYYVNPSGTTIFAGPIGIGPTSSPAYTLDVAGDMGVSEDISVVGYINTNNIYKQNNISGVNKTCGVGELLKGIHVSGGIVTAGKCSTDQTGGGTQDVILNKGLQRDSSNNFGIINCSTDQIVKYDSTGKWVCSADQTGGAGGGIGGSGTANQIAFFTGNTTISSAGNLYWNSTTNRLGIGTATPSIDLDIESDNSATYTGIEITNTDAGSRRWVMLVSNNAGSYAPSKGFGIRDIGAGETRLVIDTSGRIGIGTMDPDYKLDVDGTVQMTGFKMPGGVSGQVLTSNAAGEGTWKPPSTSGGIGGSVMYLKSVNIPEFCPTASGWSQADYRVMGDDGCGNDIRQRVCYRTDRACQVMYLQGFSVGTTPTTGPPPECPSGWLEADYSNIVEYSNFTSLKRRTCYKCE